MGEPYAWLAEPDAAMSAPSRHPPPSRPLDRNGSSSTQSQCQSPTMEVDNDGQIIPTQELQESYNKMRDLESEQPPTNLDDHLRQQQEPGLHDLLRPPSVSATSMTRSDSRSSYRSITNGLENVDLQDNAPKENTRRRSGRQGPLSRVARARTAFTRKLGACDECRSRKVKCEHLSDKLGLFERNYTAYRISKTCSQQQGTRWLQVSSSWLAPPTAPTAPTAPAACAPQWVQEQDVALLGVGSDRNLLAGQSAERQVDRDEILGNFSPAREHGNGLTPPQMPPQPAGYDIHLGLAGLNTNFSPGPALSPAVMGWTPVPIGRQRLDRPLACWECLHGNSRTLSSLSSESSGGCIHCSPSLQELLIHYRASHSEFLPLEHPFLFKCRHSSEPTSADQILPCYWCLDAQLPLEKWYFACIPLPGASPSPVPVSPLNLGVGNFSQQLNQSSPWGQFSTRSNGGSSSFFGEYNRSGYNGNQRSTEDGRRTECFDDSSEKRPASSVRPAAFFCSPNCQDYSDRAPWIHPSLAGSSRPALAFRLFLLLLYSVVFFCLPVVEGYMTKDGVVLSMNMAAARLVSAVRSHVFECSVVCIAAGLVVMWLFLHVKFRVGQGRSSGRVPGRCLMRRWAGSDLEGMRERRDWGDVDGADQYRQHLLMA